MEVNDQLSVLNEMLEDMGKQPSLYHPQARWSRYERRLERLLKEHSLQNFRANYEITKGFTDGGTPRPTLPDSAWKRAIWRALVRSPGVAQIVREYGRILASVSNGRRSVENCMAKIVMDELISQFPRIRIPQGLESGGAPNAFEWRGHTITADWVPYVCRAGDLYRHHSADNVSSLIEIGPAIGLSTLAHVALNKNIKVIVNIDIPPVTYICGQFLRCFRELEVIDYSQTRKLHEIHIQPASDGRVRVYQLPPWSIEKLRGEVDLFLNARSFQEMTPELCENYARNVNPLTKSAVMLHLGDPEQEKLDENPDYILGRSHVSSRKIIRLFSDKFPSMRIVDEGRDQKYNYDGHRAVILTNS